MDGNERIRQIGIYVMVCLCLTYSYIAAYHAKDADMHAREAVNACSINPVFDTDGKRIDIKSQR